MTDLEKRLYARFEACFRSGSDRMNAATWEAMQHGARLTLEAAAEVAREQGALPRTLPDMIRALLKDNS